MYIIYISMRINSCVVHVRVETTAKATTNIEREIYVFQKVNYWLYGHEQNEFYIKKEREPSACVCAWADDALG